MVALLNLLLTNVGPLLAQAEEQAEKITPLQKMDGATRAKVLAALAGLVILGFGMVLLIWLGGQVTRRYMRGSGEKRLPATRLPDDDWARKPLKETEPRPQADPEP